jgi:predicted NAD/FAD-binding protein
VRIAVIGGGIAGLASAWLLSREHEVVLFEHHGRLGGHTDTHKVEVAGQSWSVDSGFIVMNPAHYPLFSALLAELGVATKPTTMSFAVRNDRSGLEYEAGSAAGLFVQNRRFFSPRHWRMLADLVRFYRASPALLEDPGPGPTIGEYLERHGYGAGFRDDHLVPMASALWSTASRDVLDFPAKYLVRFMANHQMLKLSDRSPWQVVDGGSQTYVRALTARWRVDVRLSSPAQRVQRTRDGKVRVDAAGHDAPEYFDHAVIACHADEALALLAEPNAAEREVLGAIGYADNDTVLHTDASQLPRDRRAWAAWNALIPADPAGNCTVSYCMNLLQSLDCPEPLVVTLNRTAAIDPAKILKRRPYRHPQYTHASVAAQARRAEINGVDRLWYAGAYWGWGFHEDGMRSAVDVTRALGVRWPA